jgi:hypothetical protein
MTREPGVSRRACYQAHVSQSKSQQVDCRPGIGDANISDANIVDADLAMTSSCVLTKSQG